MGRAKLKINLICNEKARLTTFQKRKKGLIKKAYELQTLCNVDVCMIIYDPKTSDPCLPRQHETWPLDVDVVRRMIASYNRQPAEDQRRRTNDLSYYFEDRNKKVEDRLVKLRKSNNEILFPTWEERYNNFTEDQLRILANMLQGKVDELRDRINMMKYNMDGNNNYGSMHHEFLVPNQSSSYLMNEAMLGFIRDSMMTCPTQPTMMLMNDNKGYYLNVDNGYNQNSFNQIENFSSALPDPLLSCATNNNTMVNPDMFRPELGYFDPNMPQMLETSFIQCESSQDFNMEFGTLNNNNNIGFNNVMNDFFYENGSNG